MSRTFTGPVRPSRAMAPKWRGHGGHHGRHAMREFHPDGIVGFPQALAGQTGAPVANDIRQMLVRILHRGIAQKTCDGRDAGGRSRVEESSAGRGVAVETVLLLQQADDGEVIAQDANASRRGGASLSQCCNVGGASPTARKRSSSMAAQSAAVRWCACKRSKINAGEASCGCGCVPIAILLRLGNYTLKVRLHRGKR